MTPAVRQAIRRRWTPKHSPARWDFWFDAQDRLFTMNGSSQVDFLQDQSGRGRHFTQATDAAKPVFVASGVNGRPSFRIDGLDMMSHAASHASSLIQAGVEGSPAAVYFEHDDGAGNGAYNNPAADLATPHFWVYVWTASTYVLYRDGNIDTSGSLLNPFGSGVADNGVFFWGCDITGGGPNSFGRVYAGPGPAGGAGYIFNRSAADRGGEGDISMMGARAGRIGVEERLRLEGWGCWQLGLRSNLPAGHRYRNNRPTLGL